MFVRLQSNNSSQNVIMGGSAGPPNQPTLQRLHHLRRPPVCPPPLHLNLLLLPQEFPSHLFPRLLRFSHISLPLPGRGVGGCGIPSSSDSQPTGSCYLENLHPFLFYGFASD